MRVANKWNFMNLNIIVQFNVPKIGHKIWDNIKGSAYGLSNYDLSNYIFFITTVTYIKCVRAIITVHILFSNSYLFFSILKVNLIINGQKKPKTIIEYNVFTEIA